MMKRRKERTIPSEIKKANVKISSRYIYLVSKQKGRRWCVPNINSKRIVMALQSERESTSDSRNFCQSTITFVFEESRDFPASFPDAMSPRSHEIYMKARLASLAVRVKVLV